ncbi:MAG: glycosyltransferase family 39 protein [Candidatus Binatia bacterium]
MIAKEMMGSGNWVTLTHNGKPYYDKPAFYFWLIALGLKVLGPTEFAVRLPSALAGSLTVGVVYLWGSIAGGWRLGLWGGIVLITSLEFIALGRFAKMDMLFGLFFCAGLFYFLWWQRKTSPPSASKEKAQETAVQSQAWIWPFYLFLALASLTKGPVGVLLPLLVVGLALGLGKQWTLLRQIGLLKGMVVTALVAGPWYLLAALHDWEYMRAFLWDHNILRFFGSQQRIYHSEPTYYFLPVLLAGFLPWSLFLPLILHHLWEKRGDQGHEERFFLLVWFGTVFTFFSLSSNKLGTYILPAFAPLALLTGDFLKQYTEEVETRPWGKRWLVCATFVWLFFLVSLSPLAEMILKPWHPEYLPINVPVFPAALFILLAALASVLRKENWLPWIVSLSSLWLVLWFYGEGAPKISELRSTRSLARVLSNLQTTSPHRIITTRAESLAFYLPQKIQVVRNTSFVKAMLRESVPTVAVVKRRRIGEMRRARFFVWRDDSSAYGLVANFPDPTTP